MEKLENQITLKTLGNLTINVIKDIHSTFYVTARKLEIEETETAIFVIKTPRYDCRSVSRRILLIRPSNEHCKIFFRELNLNLEINGKLNFNDFL